VQGSTRSASIRCRFATVDASSSAGAVLPFLAPAGASNVSNCLFPQRHLAPKLACGPRGLLVRLCQFISVWANGTRQHGLLQPLGTGFLALHSLDLHQGIGSRSACTWTQATPSPTTSTWNSSARPRPPRCSRRPRGGVQERTGHRRDTLLLYQADGIPASWSKRRRPRYDSPTNWLSSVTHCWAWPHQGQRYSNGRQESISVT